MTLVAYNPSASADHTTRGYKKLVASNPSASADHTTRGYKKLVASNPSASADHTTRGYKKLVASNPIEFEDHTTRGIKMSTIQSRKVDHIELCAREEVEFKLKSTLFEEVHLIHSSLPELAEAEIDTSVEIAGKRLAAPIIITGMTGGAEKARHINHELAAVAERFGLGFGVGSQRAMLVRPETLDTYQVREHAPTALVLGNIGVVQLQEMSHGEVADMVGAIGADAICVHLNPAQEMIQVDGDRDFRGCLDALAEYAAVLDCEVIAKETGCGIAPNLVKTLRARGIKTFDLSGAGGTTWVGVEALRARPGRREIGEDFWDWGLPTAALVASARAQLSPEENGDTKLIASGGVRNGHDVAKAIALGASVAGMALPFLRAVDRNGVEGASVVAQRVIDGLRVAMLLTGSHNLEELRAAPRHLGPGLRGWLASLAQL